jgi:hypothetical protein
MKKVHMKVRLEVDEKLTDEQVQDMMKRILEWSEVKPYSWKPVGVSRPTVELPPEECEHDHFIPTKGGGYCATCGQSFMNGIGEIP